MSTCRSSENDLLMADFTRINFMKRDTVVWAYTFHVCIGYDSTKGPQLHVLVLLLLRCHTDIQREKRIIKVVNR